MKKTWIILSALVLGLSSSAQTFWTGPTVTVSKEDFADWTLPANQDYLTDNVILTRANSRGLFNIAVESEFDNMEYLSPLGTEWANGSISDGIATLTFETWDDSNDQGSPAIGQAKVLHLIDDDIYIDITITAWTQGDGEGTPPGGGFSYTRSSESASSVPEINDSAVALFPNPAVDEIELSLQSDEEHSYLIMDMAGKVHQEGLTSNGARLDVSALKAGAYLLQIDGSMISFQKR